MTASQNILCKLCVRGMLKDNIVNCILK